jgi:hypothetical protein
MKVRAVSPNKKRVAKPIEIRLPEPLYRRAKQTARASRCEVTELIVSTLEDRLVPLAPNLPPDESADLQLEYLRFSQNKAKAQYLLNRRRKVSHETVMNRLDTSASGLPRLKKVGRHRETSA